MIGFGEFLAEKIYFTTHKQDAKLHAALSAYFAKRFRGVMVK